LFGEWILTGADFGFLQISHHAMLYKSQKVNKEVGGHSEWSNDCKKDPRHEFVGFMHTVRLTVHENHYHFVEEYFNK